MQENLIVQGLELMLYGMGTVVLFLTLLVFATTAMSGVISRYFPEAPAATPNHTGNRPQAAATDDSEIAAIAAALHLHRRRRRH